MIHHQHLSFDFGTVHIAESGAADGPVVLFLHGWPQTWQAFERIMLAAGNSARTIAIDLPGVGESRAKLSDGRKSTIADAVRQIVSRMGLTQVTLVGHDVGGQVVFAYLTRYAQELAGAVIMDVVIPGIPPWESVIHNPHVWRFAFHNVPDLPEHLVSKHQAEYFDYFFNILAKNPDAIDARARRAYAGAYGKADALKTGFDWYRAFEADAKENIAFTQARTAIRTPILYIRGNHESGNIDEYDHGLRTAGLTNLRTAVVADSGHFSPEEAPSAVWSMIAP